MSVESTVGYGVTIARDPAQPGWVRVSLRKHFWAVKSGSRSRGIIWTTFLATGMSERDIIEAALRELLRQWVDRRSHDTE